MGSVAKSYMSKGFLINDEMRKYLTIYEEAVSHIWLIYGLYMRIFFSLNADRQRVRTDFQEVEITAMGVCDIAKWKLGEGGLMLWWECYCVCVTVELVSSMYTAVHYSLNILNWEVHRWHVLYFYSILLWWAGVS